MSVARTLTRIAADLRASVSEEDIDRDAIALAATRIEMQAEMLEKGLDEA